MNEGRNVTAKVRLETKSAEEAYTVLHFRPDYGDDRNQAWAYATPNLALSMTVRPEVAEQFEQGERFTLTFSRDDD